MKLKLTYFIFSLIRRSNRCTHIQDQNYLSTNFNYSEAQVSFVEHDDLVLVCSIIKHMPEKHKYRIQLARLLQCWKNVAVSKPFAKPYFLRINHYELNLARTFFYVVLVPKTT